MFFQSANLRVSGMGRLLLMHFSLQADRAGQSPKQIDHTADPFAPRALRGYLGLAIIPGDWLPVLLQIEILFVNSCFISSLFLK